MRMHSKNLLTKIFYVLVNPLALQVTDMKFRAALPIFSYALRAQDNRKFSVSMNKNMGTPASRYREFTRMSPQEFHGSKVVKVLKILLMWFIR